MATDRRKPWEKAAETKRLRTREQFIDAADWAIAQYGVNVTAEQVAAAAKLSVPTFYTVFPSRAAMFRELYHLKIDVPHIMAIRELISDDGLTSTGELRDLVSAYFDVTKARPQLVHGALVARLTDPVPPAPPIKWPEMALDAIAAGSDAEPDGDPVRALAGRLLTATVQTVRLHEMDTSRTFAWYSRAHAMALYMTDQAASGGRATGSVEMISDTLMELFDQAHGD